MRLAERSQGPAAAATGGIGLCVLGLFLFSLQDLAVKAFSDRYSVLQIVVVRSAVALSLIALAVWVTAGLRGFLTVRPGLLLARGLLGFCSFLAYYLAIAALPLAEVVVIVFSAPLFVTVLSALLLGETVGRRRWASAVVGFAAIVLVVDPSGDFAKLGAALALVAALAYAGTILMLRYIGERESSWTVSLYCMAMFLAGGVVTSILVAVIDPAGSGDPSIAFLLRPWMMPAPVDGAIMLLLGGNAAFSFYCLARAYQVAPASVVAPFEYSYIVWAVLFGYWLWAEVPDTGAVLGVGLLLGVSLYGYCRERVLKTAYDPIVGRRG